MKIVKNCWDQIDVYNCQYGAHVFQDGIAQIYVNQWLSPSRDLFQIFYKKNDEGFVGHCLLVFKGVKTFDFSVYILQENENSKIMTHDPVVFRYRADIKGETTKYEFEGSLHGFPSSVSASIEAQQFELHILEKDEPARQS